MRLTLPYSETMSNAASELADLLESWTVSGNATPTQTRRETDTEDSADFWRGQSRAVELARECDQAVQAMRRSGIEVRGFTYYIDEWYAAVFSYNLGWRDARPQPSSPIEAPALLALRQLSPWLSRNWGGSTTQEQRHEFSRVLTDLDVLLSEIGDELSSDERQYILRLLTAARTLLEEHAILQDSDIREHLDALNGALLRAAADLTGKGKSESAKRVLDLVSQLVVIAGGLVTVGQTAVDAGRAFMSAIGAG